MTELLLPAVRHVRDVGNRNTPTQVYVGRPSIWGNPWLIGPDGTREKVVELFRNYIMERLKTQPNLLEPLRGKDLVCWCAPEACHADILLELANA